MKKFLLMCALVLSVNAIASKGSDRQVYDSDMQNKAYLTHSNFTPEIVQLKTNPLEQKQKHIDYINSLLQGKSEQRDKAIKPAEGLILFVSFSMPDSLLVSLSEEANRYHIPLVIRGLVDNDFKKTLLKLKRLQDYARIRKQTFHGLSIDPLWFEQFGIEAVPALIATKRPNDCPLQKTCPNQPFDVVYGNGSLKQSLELIRDRSDAFHAVADTALKGEGHA